MGLWGAVRVGRALLRDVVLVGNEGTHGAGTGPF